MLPNRTCPNSNCANRGILTLDANSLFFLIEGTIRYVQGQYLDLTTNTSRVPCILEELDSYLGIIKGCCSLDGTLYISDWVFNEVSLDDRREIIRKGLIELKKYSNAQRGQMLQVLRSHFPRPTVVSEQEIRAMRGLFPNPEICPHDRDASLIIVACGLATCGQPTIVLTSDPDFAAPIKWLVRQSVVTLSEGHTFPTDRILNRTYFHFLLRLHDCCGLASDRYKPLAEAYFNAQVQRLPRLRRNNVVKRITDELQEMWKIHTKSVQYKVAGASL